MSASPPLFLVLSGPSGSGKTTLCRLAAGRMHLHYGISHTTRKIRSDEMHGRDYFFVTEKEFSAMIGSKAFLEHADVYGNHYGTSKSEVYDYLGRGQGVVLDVDTQGAMAIKKEDAGALLVFIKTPSLKVLEERLLKRKTDRRETIKKRLARAHEEEKLVHHYDHVIINDNLERAYQELENIAKKVHHGNR